MFQGWRAGLQNWLGEFNSHPLCMKKYDEKLRKYVSVEEYERTHKPQDKAFCRGKKPHDFVLVLPYYTQYDERYKYNPEEFYRIMDERYEFIEKQKKQLEAMGIQGRDWNRKETRLYICSVCKKHKHEWLD